MLRGAGAGQEADEELEGWVEKRAGGHPGEGPEGVEGEVGAIQWLQEAAVQV